MVEGAGAPSLAGDVAVRAVHRPTVGDRRGGSFARVPRDAEERLSGGVQPRRRSARCRRASASGRARSISARCTRSRSDPEITMISVSGRRRRIPGITSSPVMPGIMRSVDDDVVEVGIEHFEGLGAVAGQVGPMPERADQVARTALGIGSSSSTMRMWRCVLIVSSAIRCHGSSLWQDRTTRARCSIYRWRERLRRAGSGDRWPERLISSPSLRRTLARNRPKESPGLRGQSHKIIELLSGTPYALGLSDALRDRPRHRRDAAAPRSVSEPVRARPPPPDARNAALAGRTSR